MSAHGLRFRLLPDHPQANTHMLRGRARYVLPRIFPVLARPCDDADHAEKEEYAAWALALFASDRSPSRQVACANRASLWEELQAWQDSGECAVAAMTVVLENATKLAHAYKELREEADARRALQKLQGQTGVDLTTELTLRDHS